MSSWKGISARALHCVCTTRNRKLQPYVVFLAESNSCGHAT